MLNKVCVLTIRVPNLQESVDFYSNILGFKVSKYYGAKIVSLEHDEIPIVLEESEDAYQNPKQNVLLGLISADLDKDISHLKSKGVKILFDEARPCPPGRYNIIEDPAGNQIEVVEFSN
ncbi:VOC family protein [Cytobacillus dafuensis]|uniref:VOC family protein n=1 Tax=Cytobacillus dafuensis TaxID=1742359 RepID=A0A5B8Z0G1_CYTDA|nr:VOC family protein [Cytobacillus dafuensis]QED46241.1 VOC family protein [Cytobacillus dafuensis]